MLNFRGGGVAVPPGPLPGTAPAEYPQNKDSEYSHHNIGIQNTLTCYLASRQDI